MSLTDIFSSVFGDSPFALFFVIAAVVVGLVMVLAAAPVFLAEALLDGLLVAGLWRRFSRQGTAGSVRGALRATRVPAAAVILGLAVLGLFLQWIAPSADSIGDVFRAAADSAG